MFAEAIPLDIAGMYGESYFQKPVSGRIPKEGYFDYEMIPPSEFLWRINLIKYLCPCPSEGKLLDIGCATGKFLEMARSNGWDVYGVEISAYAANRARNRGLNVHTGTLESASYDTGFFDIITAFDVLEHLVDPKGFLHEVRRILKPGGTFILLTPNAGAYRAKTLGDQWIGFTASLEHTLYFTPDSLRTILRETLGKDPFMITLDQGEYDTLIAVVQNSAPGPTTYEQPRLKALLVNRVDALALPGGDTIQMLKTRDHLDRLGVQADISLSLSPEASGYDIIHIFNTQKPQDELPQMRHLRNYEIPLVLSPIYWDTSEALWATLATKAAFNQARNEAELREYLEAIQDGSLVVNGVSAFLRPEFYPGFRDNQKELLQLPNIILPNSYLEMRQIGLSLGIYNKRFEVVPNAVETDVFAQPSPEWFISRYGIKDFIVTVGRFEALKNQLMLLYALRDTGFPIVLIGSSADPEYLELCRRYAPPGTLFIVNNLSQAQLASAFAAARVHVLPSWRETPGLVSLEAALAGCNNVVSDRGAQWEYFREYAYYCNPASIESIREAVVLAYENYERDKEKREEFKQLILEKFTWEKAARKTLQAYFMVLKEPQPPQKPRFRASVIIPVFNKVEFTKACLEALAKNTPEDLYEVIIVDNASSDGTKEFLRTLQGDVRVITNDENLGFAKACNQGAAIASGEYLVFLNNDTLPQPGWLEALLRVVDNEPDVAVVGAKLLFPDGTIQHAGVAIAEGAPYPITVMHMYYRYDADAPEVNEQRDCQAVTGACLLIRPDVYREIGGFCEEYRNGYEDVDLCFKVRERGYRIVYSPESVLYHFESVTPGRHKHEKDNIRLLHEKWMGRLNRKENQASETTPSSRSPVSVVIVTYNSFLTLSACLESVFRNSSPEDEIIVVDNGSIDETQFYLRLYARDRKNLKLIFNNRNVGFSQACNQGIMESSKDYIVLLNPDTVIFPCCFERLQAHFRSDKIGAVGPTSDYVAGAQKVNLYLNEEMVKQAKDLTNPAEVLYKFNAGRSVETKLLIGFCLMIPRRVLEDIGPLDDDLFLGNDDLELSWRLQQNGYRLLVATDVFVHHRGQVSFRSESAAKTAYLVQQSTNFLANKLRKAYGYLPAGEELWGIGWFRPSSGRTSIIVPVCNGLAYTRQCLESVFARTPEPFELIVIDNGSSDGTPSYLRELQASYEGIRVIRNEENLGFAVAVNQGISSASGNYIVLLNNDTVVTKGWLSRLLAALTIDEETGLAGPVSNYVAGSQMVQDASYGTDLREMERYAGWRAIEFAGKLQETNRVIFFCTAIKRAVIDKIGGLDLRFHNGNFEDDDFCLRARIAGFRIQICEDVFIHHYGSQTFKENKLNYTALMEENWERFKAKWGLARHLTLRDGYPAEQIIRQAFDPAKHYCPLYGGETATGGDGRGRIVRERRSFLFLACPEWDSPAKPWANLIRAYAQAFEPEEDVTLALWVDPRGRVTPAEAIESLFTELASSNLDPDHAPDIVLLDAILTEAAVIKALTEAQAYIPLGPEGVESQRRTLAEAHGCSVIDGIDAQALRDAVWAIQALR